MTDDFDPKVLGGSVKRGIVNPDLAEERAKCDFDKTEIRTFLYGQDTVDYILQLCELVKKYPELNSSIGYYELSR